MGRIGRGCCCGGFLWGACLGVVTRCPVDGKPWAQLQGLLWGGSLGAAARLLMGCESLAQLRRFGVVSGIELLGRYGGGVVLLTCLGAAEGLLGMVSRGCDCGSFLWVVDRGRIYVLLGIVEPWVHLRGLLLAAGLGCGFCLAKLDNKIRSFEAHKSRVGVPRGLFYFVGVPLLLGVTGFL